MPGTSRVGAGIENVIIDLVRSKRIKGVNTGDHATDEIGDMVIAELRKSVAAV